MLKKSCIILLLILLPIIAAQPPFAQEVSFTEGYEIKIPSFGTLKQGEDFTFSFHLYNISNGVPIDNSSTQCDFHLYNSSGEHLVEGNNFEYTTEHGALNEWEITVLKGNLSEIGSYSYLVSCNSTLLGGFESVNFEVTGSGQPLNEPNSILYVILFFGAFLIFLLSLWGASVLPMKNKRDGLGEIIDIGILKYFKIALMFVTYTLFVWLVNLLISLSNNFNLLTQYGGFFVMIFEILRSLIWPLFIVMWITFIVLGWKDLQLIKLLSRGLKPK